MASLLLFRSTRNTLLRKTVTHQQVISSSSIIYRFLSVDAASSEQIIPGVGKGKTSTGLVRNTRFVFGNRPFVSLFRVTIPFLFCLATLNL